MNYDQSHLRFVAEALHEQAEHARASVQCAGAGLAAPAVRARGEGLRGPSGHAVPSVPLVPLVPIGRASSVAARRPQRSESSDSPASFCGALCSSGALHFGRTKPSGKTLGIQGSGCRRRPPAASDLGLLQARPRAG